jgi:type I restriction enzyme M protein
MSLGNFLKRVRDITRNDAGVNGDAQRIEQLTWMLFLKIYDDKEAEWELLDDDFYSIIPEPMRWRNWADTSNPKGLKGEELLNFVNNELFPTLKNLDLPPNCPKSKSIVKAVFEDIHNYMKDGVLLRQIITLINEFNFTDPEETHTFGEIYETLLRDLQSAGSAGEYYTPRALTDFMAEHVNLKIGDQVADLACGTGGFLNSAHKILNLIAEAGTNEQRKQLDYAFIGVEKKPLPYLLCVTNLLLNGISEPNLKHANSLVRPIGDYGERDKVDVILMNPPFGGSEKPEILQNFPAALRSSETADLFLILIMTRLKDKGRAAVIVPDGFLFGTGNKAAIKERLLRRFNLHTIVRLPTTVFSPYTNIATNILFFDGPAVDKREGRRNSPWATNATWFYRLDMPKGYKHFSKTKPILREHLQPLYDWWQNKVAIEENGIEKAKSYLPEELQDLGFNFDLCGFPQEEEEILPPHEMIEKFQIERARHQAAMDKTLNQILSMIGGKSLC